MIARNQFQRLRGGLVVKKVIDDLEAYFYQLTSEQKNSYGIARENIRALRAYDYSIRARNGRTIAQIDVQIYYVPVSGDLINKSKFDDNSDLHVALFK